jgi:cell division septum initiation protein DivIVA
VAHPAVWKAATCLRRAETLSGLAGVVSGPADTAPAALSTEWVQDWIDRAKKALERALDEARRDADESKEKARRIAEAVKEGAESINPFVQARKTAEAVKQSVTEGADSVSEKLSRGLERVIAFAKKVIIYSTVGVGVAALLWFGFTWLVMRGAGKTLDDAASHAERYTRLAK